MIKKLITVILLLIHLSLLQGVSGQNPANMTDYLSQRFLKYCKSVPREEIFIHSDRKEYVSGEELWFNIYLIDRQSFRPSVNSRIVYFELLNAVNRPVVQKRIQIDKGSGPGQIVLPDTLSTGIYTIRAYTSWMKNFLPDNCFEMEINVFNTLNNKPLIYRAEEEKRIKPVRDNILVKESKNTGLTLELNNSKPDFLKIFINTTDEFRSENNDLIYTFIQTHGNINHVSAEKMTGKTTMLMIPKSLLNSGINQVTIFNSKFEPVGDRFIYTPDAGNNSIKIYSADSSAVRRKIELEIDIEKETSEPINSTNLSISVAPETNGRDISDINDYMIFGTEYGFLPRSIINGRKVESLDPGIIDSILLNVKSNWIDWARVLSGELPHFSYRSEKEYHYLLGKLIASDQQTVHSTELILLSAPGKEAIFQYAKTDNKGNFSFSINIDQVLKDLVIMPDDISKNHKIIIESSFSDKYRQSDKPVDSSASQIPRYIAKFSVNHQVQTIFGTTSVGDPLPPAFQLVKPVRFYGKPDIELILADYIGLPVISEIFFELLPGVSLKKKKSLYEISIVDRVDDDRYVLSPCLMIDGVIIKDASLIANLDPEIVERIDVIKEKYLVGKYFFSGIVNVITKSGDFSSVSLPDYMIRMPYKVIEPVFSFDSPDYSSEERRDDRVPDYRNTLYWNPSVKPDKDGKARVEFWSSDNKSDYLVNIQGITQSGKMFSLKKIIKVR